ncbi:MAG: L,D-transpeptidase [Paracoccaceae bacterium]
MAGKSDKDLSRRGFLAAGAAALGSAAAAPALAQDAFEQLERLETSEGVWQVPPPAKRNISSFRTLSWEPYFSNLRNGAILVDTQSRALHYWSEDKSIYRLYPTSVPLSEEMTRRGRTSVIRMVEGPAGVQPARKPRTPEWPDPVRRAPHPLGTHALYLSWQYYRIHGTHDTRKIGRRSSNGCIGLYNDHISQLYALTKVGTQVLLI